jgi:hypothetical protein
MMMSDAAEHEVPCSIADTRFRVRLHPIDIPEIRDAMSDRLYGKRGDGADIG